MSVENVLLEHQLSFLVDDVTILVDQVARAVDCAPFLIDIRGALFFQNWLALRIIINVAHNLPLAELREREDLWELTVLQMLLLPKLLAVDVHYVAVLVHQVAFLVHATAEVVDKAIF